MESISREIERCRPLEPDDFVEIPLVSDMVHLICGGDPEPVTPPAGDEDISWAHWVKVQTDQVLEFGELSRTIKILKRHGEGRGEGSHLGVTIETAIPEEHPRLSLAFVAINVLSHTEHQNDEQGSAEQLTMALALFDFLTASPHSGAGAVAARSLSMEWEPRATRYSTLHLHAHFGLRPAEAAVQTPVLQALATKDADAIFEDIGKHLDEYRMQTVAEALADSIHEFRAARACLEAAVDAKAAVASGYAGGRNVGENAASVAAELASKRVAEALQEYLGYSDPLPHLSRLSAALGADNRDPAALATTVGFELYENAVRDVLAAVGDATGSLTARGASEELQKLTVVEIPACASRAFARGPRDRVIFDPEVPLTEDELFCVGGANTAVRNCHRRRVFERRWREHLGDCEGGSFQDGCAKLKDTFRRRLSKETPTSSRLEDCFNHTALKTVERERSIRFTASGCGPAWRSLCEDSGNFAWSQTCEVLAKRADSANASPQETTPAAKDVAGLLRRCDTVLALKIIVNKGAASPCDFASQLVLVGCPLFVSIWRSAFPIKASLEEAPPRKLTRLGLEECWDFLECSGKVYLRPEAWSRLQHSPEDAGDSATDSEGASETPSQPDDLPEFGSMVRGAMVPRNNRDLCGSDGGHGGGHGKGFGSGRGFPNLLVRSVGNVSPTKSSKLITSASCSPSKEVVVPLASTLPPPPFLSCPVFQPAAQATAGTPTMRTPCQSCKSSEGNALSSTLQQSVSQPQFKAGNSPSETSQAPPMEQPRARGMPGFADPWQSFRGESLVELNEGIQNVADSFPDADLWALSPALAGRSIGWLSATRLNWLSSVSRGQGGCPGASRVCEKVDPTCILPGFLGDSWLVAAMSALAEFRTPLLNLFQRHVSKHGHRPFQDVDGLYELELYDPDRNFAKTVVKINDKVPCFRQDDMHWRPLFASTLCGELWPMLLEKGVAQLLGGYHALNGNRAPLAWAVLTGETQYSVVFRWPKYIFTYEQSENCAAVSGSTDAAGSTWGAGDFRDLGRRSSNYTFRREPGNELAADWVWERLRCSDIDGKVMACTFRSLDEPVGTMSQGHERDEHGCLLANRSYSVLSVQQVTEMLPVQKGAAPKSRMHRLVQLRNPWGEGREWTGPWAKASKEWDEHPLVTDQLEYGRSRRLEDGSFWMPWEAFLKRLADVIVSDASFKNLYGPRVRDVSSLWSDASLQPRRPLAQFGSALAPLGIDFWRNLDVRDPDVLQADLSSWPDGFPVGDILAAPTAAGIKWLSASRLHRLLQCAPDERHGEVRSAWVQGTGGSQAGAVEVKVCGRVDVGVLLVGGGNAWLVAAFLPLAQLRWPVEDALSRCPVAPVNGTDGPYTLMLYDPDRDFQRRAVVINDQVPCFARFGNDRSRPGGWRPCFTGALHSEMWPMLLEKGIASVLLGYGALHAAGCVPLVWAIITGETAYGAIFPWRASKSGACDTNSVAFEWGCGEFDLRVSVRQSRYGYRYEPQARNCQTMDWAWERLCGFALAGRLLACTFLAQSGETFVAGGAIVVLNGIGSDSELEEGLDPTLTYTILAIRPVALKQVRGAAASDSAHARRQRSARTLRFVKLLGPWSAGCEWRGRWARGAVEWQTEPEVAAILLGEEGSSQGTGDAGLEDGVFWMVWEDFVRRVKDIVFSEVPFLPIESSSAVPSSQMPPACVPALSSPTKWQSAASWEPLRLTSNADAYSGASHPARTNTISRSREEQTFLDTLLLEALEASPPPPPPPALTGVPAPPASASFGAQVQVAQPASGRQAPLQSQQLRAQPVIHADSEVMDAQQVVFDGDLTAEEMYELKANLVEHLRQQGVPEDMLNQLRFDIGPKAA